MKNDNNDVNKFWKGFHKTVIAHGVSNTEACFYVKWGEKFAVSMKGIPLRQRTAEDIIGFIAKLKKDKNLEDWQIDQARKALYILYYKYLKLPSIIDKSKNNGSNSITDLPRERNIQGQSVR